jgi:hypothetical protein
MRRKVTAVAVVATAAITLAACATAGPVATKQRVAIEGKGANGFVLTPLTGGALERDSGAATFCCWSSRSVVRDGERQELITGHEMTLVGKHGTLVARSRMEGVDVTDGFSVVTGTWTVVRGTGAYARLAGGGRVAVVGLPNGTWKWRRDGLLGPK